jgi:nucleotide-binding universal stress UspA family protein
VNEYTSPRRGPKSVAAQERIIRKRLAAIQARLQADFVPAEINVRHGMAALQILAEADGHDTEIIVIGSHGHTAFFELLLGSTTQTVLKRAQQPVLVIPPKMRKPRRTRVRVVSLSTAALPSGSYEYPPPSS